MEIFWKWHDWKSWATLQIERGDEALVANFGIDIRILGFIEWDSRDDARTMADLWYDLESKTKHYLKKPAGVQYDVNGWYNYVDAIIGVVSQETPDEPDVPGIAPGTSYLDQGRIFVVVKWWAYWMDDNIIQHEVSHLFEVDDHRIPGHRVHCVMEGGKHPVYWLYEDGLWMVFNDIPCCYLTYSWCDETSTSLYRRQCFTYINQRKSRFQSDLPVLIAMYYPFIWANRPGAILYWYDEEKNITWTECRVAPHYIGWR